MSDEDLHIPPLPWRSKRAWLSLIFGVILVGIGLGVMIDAGLGVAPADAFFTGVSRTSGLTVGTVLFIFSLLMVLGSWALGLAPTIGTLVCFVFIAVFVDLTRWVIHPFAIPDMTWWMHTPIWIAGLIIFSAGVLGLFSSDLGVSPYDQVVRVISLRTGRSLGFARLIVDGLAFLGALLLGGSWGIGTVILLIAVPLVLNVALPRFKPWVRPA